MQLVRTTAGNEERGRNPVRGNLTVEKIILKRVHFYAMHADTCDRHKQTDINSDIYS